MSDRDIRTSLFNSEEPSVRHQNDQTHMLHVRDEEVAALRETVADLRVELYAAKRALVGFQLSASPEQQRLAKAFADAFYAAEERVKSRGDAA